MGSSRLAYIDGLKGISCLIVLLCHIGDTLWGLGFVDSHQSIICDIISSIFIRDFFDGNFAVWVFVILSSMLTCYKIDRADSNTTLGIYQSIVKKRYFRIFFPVGIVIFLMFISNKTGILYAEQLGAKIKNGWLMGQYVEPQYLLKSIIMAPFGRCGYVLNVGWMLYLVFIGTFVIIILDLLFRDAGKYTFFCGLFFCCIVAFWFDFRYISVLIGYGLYFSGKKLSERKRILCGVLFISLFIFLEFYKHTEFWNLIRAASVVGFVYCVKEIQSIFSVKSLVWLGRLSFNIYILQLFIIYTVTCRLADNVNLGNNLSVILIFIITILLVILFSWVWSKLVDPYVTKLTNSAVSML